MLTYDNYINKCGYSGTEASVIQIIKCINDIHASGNYGDQYNHWYINHPNPRLRLLTITNNTKAYILNKQYIPDDCSVFIVLQFISEANSIILSHRKKLTIIVWLHAMLYNHHASMIHKWMEKHTVRIIGVGPLITNAQSHPSVTPLLKDIYSKALIIPNKIDDLFINLPMHVPTHKRGNNVIFHACFDRGGIHAYHIFHKLKIKDSTFNIVQYDSSVSIPQYIKNDPKVNILPSMSKVKMRDILLTMRCFIYPLSTPVNTTHQDTYACAVDEALHCKVHVFTFNTYTMTHLYSSHEYMHLITLPDNIDGTAPFITPDAYINIDHWIHNINPILNT